MTLLRLAPLFCLGLLAACHEPHTTAPTGRTESIRVASAPRAPTGDAVASVDPMTPPWAARTQRLALPNCDATFQIPVIVDASPLAEGVATWVKEELAKKRELLEGSGPCSPPLQGGTVSVTRVRGFVRVAFWLPTGPGEKFTFPTARVFSSVTGSPLVNVIAESKREELNRHLQPRYREAIERASQGENVADGCRDVAPRYAPSFDDFAVVAEGFVFHGWNSLPMWAKACMPTPEPITRGDELDAFLTPEARAAWRTP